MINRVIAGVGIVLVLTFCSLCAYAAPSLYDDKRMQKYADLYLAAELKKGAKAAEKDLKSDNPHPLSSEAWLEFTEDTADGPFHRIWERVPEKTKQLVGPIGVMQALSSAGKGREALDLFSPDSPELLGHAAAYAKLSGIARDFGDDRLRLAYELAGLKQYPSYFELAWNVLARRLIPQDIATIEAALAETSAWQGTVLEKALKARIDVQSFNDATWAQLHEVALLWLEEYPNEANALEALAHWAGNVHQHQIAFDASMRGYRLSPYTFGWIRLAKAAIFTERKAEVEPLLLARSKIFSRSKNFKPYVERYWAGAYKDLGYRNTARELLTNLLPHYSQSKYLLRGLASLEKAEGRYIEEVRYREEVAALKDSVTLYDKRMLVDAYLNAGMVPQADAVMADLLNAQPIVSVTDYQRKARLLEKQGSSEHLVWLQQAVATLPTSDDLWSAYADAVEGESLAALRERFEARQKSFGHNPSSYQLRKLVEAHEDWITAAEPRGFRKQHLDFLSSLAERYPAHSEIYKQQVKFLGYDGAKKALFWRDTVAAHPRFLTLHTQRYAEAEGEKNWEAAHAALNDLESAHRTTPVWGADSWLRLNTAWIVLEEQRTENVGQDRLEEALAGFDAYRDVGDLYTYHNGKRQLLRAMGRFDDAGEHLLALADIQPVSKSWFANLISARSTKIPSGARWSYGLRMLNEKRYDSDILWAFVHRHVRWGGSPVVALWALDRAEKLGVKISDSQRAQAYGQLGDPITDFEKQYHGDYSLGDSTRYINWYQTSTAKVLQGGRNRFVYRFEPDVAALEIHKTNGEVLYRRDSIALARVIEVAQGAIQYKINYDEAGNWLGISDQRGDIITLTYNDLNQIVTMVRRDGRRLQFRYNEIGKPIHIEIPEMGAISVQYDDYGEILKVDSEQGSNMALAVTQEFQRLLSLTKKIKVIGAKHELPRFAFAAGDPAYTTLKEQLDASYSQADYGERYENATVASSAVAMIDYLQAHLADDADYMTEALEYTEALIKVGMDPDAELDARIRAAELLKVWRDLKLKQKAAGLQTSEFSWWRSAKLWLQSQVRKAESPAFAQAMVNLSDSGVELLASEQWLPKNLLKNKAFWRHEALDILLSNNFSGATYTDMLPIGEGSVLLGTSKGLLANLDGRWRWLGFDDRVGKWSTAAEFGKLGAKSDVRALATDADGNIWIGTAGGIQVVTPDLKQVVKRFESRSHGLPSIAVTDIVPQENGTMLVATMSGLSEGTIDGMAPLDAFQGKPVQQIIANALSDAGRLLVVRRDDGLYFLSGQTVTRVAKGPVQDALWYGPERSVVMLQKDRVYILRWANDNTFEAPALVPGQERVNRSLTTYGIESLEVPGVGTVLAVMSDQGIGFYKDWHFEFMELPHEDRRDNLVVGPRQVASYGRHIWMATHEGLYTFDAQQAPAFDFVTNDMLTMEKYGITFAATNSGLMAFTHGSDRPERYEYMRGYRLAKMSEDAFLVATAGSVVKVDLAAGDQTEIFELDNPEVDSREWQSGRKVSSLLYDQAGDIWVVKGDTLHHHKTSEGTTERYNFAIDPDKFPAFSDMLQTVYQRPNGDILVSASYEAHRYHRNRALEGGLLRYKGDGTFERVLKEDNSSLFNLATAYTKISDDRYVLNTNAGLQLFDIADGGMVPVERPSEDLEGPSWLGYGGVQYDQDSYLFGTGTGIVVLHKKQWYLAKQLNSLLPRDREFGQYGGRSILALASDPEGRIYVSTPVGTTILSLPNGIKGLLVDNGYGRKVFENRDVEHLENVASQFVENVDPKSRAGRLLAQLTQIDEQIKGIEEGRGVGESQVADTQVPDPEAAMESLAAKTKMAKELEDRKRRRERLLARLENENRGLFQMLKLDPRETESVADKLGPREVVVQYLPDGDTLHIQVTDQREGSQIISIPVNAEEMFASARRSSQALAKRAGRLHRVRGIEISAAEDDAQETEEEQLAIDASSLLVGDLSYLYDILLRPIEGKLTKAEIVYVVPVGELSYVPFPALVRSVEPAIEYAVEAYSFSTITSLFHLNLVLDEEAEPLDMALLVANPDQTLPYAEKEVRTIEPYLGQATTLIGEAAEYDAVMMEMPDHGIIHFATHAHLDNEAPYRSYLKLAGNKRLNVIDIGTLDLQAARLAVLSACQTGRGINGFEYATLARAFVHAKVPSVIASLWSVDDEATGALMVGFYRYLTRTENVAKSLAMAQRDMLRQEGPNAWPEAWAGMSLFGKP